MWLRIMITGELGTNQPTTDSAESILEESKTIDGIDGIFDRISKTTDIGQKARKHNIKSSWVI